MLCVALGEVYTCGAPYVPGVPGVPGAHGVPSVHLLPWCRNSRKLATVRRRFYGITFQLQ